MRKVSIFAFEPVCFLRLLQSRRSSSPAPEKRKVINLPRAPAAAAAAAAFSWNYFATRAPRAPRLKLSRAIVCSQLGWSAQIRPNIVCDFLYASRLCLNISPISLCVAFIFVSFSTLDGVSGSIWNKMCIYSHSISANNRIKSGPASRMNS